MQQACFLKWFLSDYKKLFNSLYLATEIWRGILIIEEYENHVWNFFLSLISTYSMWSRKSCMFYVPYIVCSRYTVTEFLKEIIYMQYGKCNSYKGNSEMWILFKVPIFLKCGHSAIIQNELIIWINWKDWISKEIDNINTKRYWYSRKYSWEEDKRHKMLILF